MAGNVNCFSTTHCPLFKNRGSILLGPAMSPVQYIYILVSLAKRSDSWSESRKYRWDRCLGMLLKEALFSCRCYFAFHLSLFSWLEHENDCWSSSGHFVIKRASTRTCQKPQPLYPKANEPKPAVADLWTLLYGTLRPLLRLCLYFLHDQNSDMLIAEV